MIRILRRRDRKEVHGREEMRGRMVAEGKLKAAEDTARAVLNATLETIVLIDRKGKVLDVNQTGALRIGFKREEIIGRYLYDFFPSAVVQKRKQLFAKVISSRGPIRFQDSRAKRFYENSAYPVLDKKGKVTTIAIFAADVTEKKSAEEELRRKKEELRAQAIRLEEMNTTLKVLLDQREKEKEELAETILATVRSLILPYLERIEAAGLDSKARSFVAIIKSNLADLLSRSRNRALSPAAGLTSTEIMVADFIKNDKTSKEIAALMGVSVSAVFVHRYNIRRKLGILNKKVNLKSCLRTLN